MPDNPTQPGQLPGQQFAVSNDATRNQSRMARLEERVKQLEQGKQLIQAPMFRWTYEAQISSVTTYTWTISMPYPPAKKDPGALLKQEELFYWFSIPITAVGGAVSGDIVFTAAGLTYTWTWSIASAGTTIVYGPNPAGTTAVASGGRSSLMQAIVTTDSPGGAYTDVSLRVTRTSASNSFTLGAPAVPYWPKFYGIIPPSLAS